MTEYRGALAAIFLTIYFLFSVQRNALCPLWFKSFSFFTAKDSVLKGTNSLGCNVPTTVHDIAVVFYAGGCCDDFSHQRHVLTDSFGRAGSIYLRQI